ncbi:MAG TPA: YwgA family protein [Bacillales bacterium]|nr:YwgA family protein [Bacillales bacterium]
MLEDHAKLLEVLHHARDGIGRRKLQKILYVLKKLHFPFHEQFHFQFYGPYSEEAALRVQELCNLKFLHEQESGKGHGVYVLSEEGKAFLQHHDVHMPGLDRCVHLLNAQSTRFLTLLATVLHFSELPPKETERKVFAHHRQQGYTKQDIEEAVRFGRQLQPKHFAM